MSWFNINSIETKKARMHIDYVLKVSEDPHNIPTPFPLCKEIIEKLPSLFGKILVVANLEFVYTLKQRGVDLTRLYFATPCPIKAIAAESILSRKNIFIYKTVIEEKDVYGMKFDTIVGNPPFQEGNTGVNKTLYHKFYHQVLKLVVENGTIVLISPTTWLRSTKPMLKKLNDTLRLNGLYEVTPLDPQQVFGITVDSLGVVWINKTQPSKLIVEPADTLVNKIQTAGNFTLTPHRGKTRQLTKQGDQTQNGIGNVSFIADSVHIYKTVNRVSNGTGNYEVSWCDTIVDDDRKNIRVVYGIISTNKGIGPTHIFSNGENLTQMCCYISVDTKEEAFNLEQYLQSNIFTFMLNQLRPNTTNSLGIIRKIPIVDFTRTWTDQKLYQHFNLTEDEIKLIEDTIK